jgi:uncharacterized protein YggE
MRAALRLLPCCLILAACGHPPPDRRGVGHDEVLVQIAASGSADTRPDEARFTAGVTTVNAEAGAASAGNNQAMARVVAALRAAGIRADDIQTQSITLNRLDYGPNRGRFEADNRVEVRVRDLGHAGQAIAAATGAGANVLSGPNLRVSDPEAASRSAYARAYRAARARAEAYAQAAGLRVARVLAIRDAEAAGSPIGLEEDMSMAPGAAQGHLEPPVQAGTSVSVVSIRVDFALAPQ